MHTQNRVVQSCRARRAYRKPVAVARSSRNAGSRWRAAAVAMSLGCAVTGTRADSITDYIQFEAGIGGADYARGSDGLWVQDGFEHKVNLTAPAFEVGVTGDLYQAASWGLSWHLDYAWLGTIHSQSLATPSDANYNVKTKGCNGPCWPLANYMGSGHDQGFLLTLEPHYDYNGWRFGIEAGPYLHSSTWTEDVTGWVATPTTAPVNLSVKHQPKFILGYVLGASIGYRNFFIAYQIFHNQRANGDPVPPIWRDTQMLMVKYRY